LAFGYDFVNATTTGRAFYTLFDKNRKMKVKHEIALTSKRMIHDFIMTENYVVIPDLPMEFSPLATALNSKFIFQFDKNLPARYGVMKRNAQDSKDIRWFELPAHMVVHWINAWEEKNEEGDDIIKVYGCQQADVNLDIADEHPFVNDAQQTIAKWTFNLITGKAQMEELIPDLKVEWPIISQDIRVIRIDMRICQSFQTRCRKLNME